jgi:hypothetical protein
MSIRVGLSWYDYREKCNVLFRVDNIPIPSFISHLGILKFTICFFRSGNPSR